MFYAWHAIENPQTLRIGHETRGEHEHDWNGNFLAGGLLDAWRGLRRLPFAVSAIRQQLDHLSKDPHDEPQPAHHRHRERDEVIYLHPADAHVASRVPTNRTKPPGGI
jgi:hypothetical protein